jgi:hypothetical protein
MSTNYNKWDQYANSLIDSDEEDNYQYNRNVQVTKLENASSIKIGPQGSEIIHREVNNLNSASHSYKNNSSFTAIDDSNFPSSIDNVCSSKNNNNGTAETKISNIVQAITLNGGYTGTYYWSQTRDEVIIRKLIDINTKARDIMVSYTDDAAARFEGGRPLLKISNKVCGNILSGSLQFDILPNDKEITQNSGLADAHIDWEIIEMVIPPLETKSRVIEITLKKKSPIPGTAFWWKNVFVGDPEIDLNEISGRSENSSIGLDSWQEAHRQFQQRVQENVKEQISVDISEDDDDDISEDEC